VELLSREGEIAIAKRIEAGREAMIAGLCESPLTFQAIIIWRDELNDGKVLLRDIIDLDATYGGPDAKALPTPEIGPDGQMIANVAIQGQPGRLPQMPAPDTAPVTAIPFKPAGKNKEPAARGTIAESYLDEDDDDKENWLSVAAIEAELKPKVIESIDAIAGTYKRLRRLQDQDIQFQLRRLSLSPAQERKYKKLKNEIIGEVKSLRLNRARIDALLGQLYESTSGSSVARDAYCGLPRATASCARISSRTIWAPSSTRFGSTACRNFPPAAGRTSLPAPRTASRSCARRSIRRIGQATRLADAGSGVPGLPD